MNNILTFKYIFKHADGKENVFTLDLNENTLSLVPKERTCFPDWVQLSHNQCPNCKLDPQKHSNCPIAINVIDVIETYSKSLSYEEVLITCETNMRTYSKKTSLQQGISSLMGFLMAASDCPVVSKLKPMVRYHLPFSTDVETMYRVVSMYLVAQYFLLKEDKFPDIELKGLQKIYSEIDIMNRAFCERLKEVKIEDANLNAVVKLNTQGGIVSFLLSENLLDDLKIIFKTYLNE
ncbi:MAG: hypothetical protein ABIA04_15150 [Pseudomonadota bacterium]